MPVPDAVSVALPPAQEVVGPEMLTVGFGFTVTDCGDDVDEQPFA